MNVLIVDDQPAVLESLKRDVPWAEVPVERVFTAQSAREARMVIRNFDVDVLLTDIEMPEEDGLSLFRWMREAYPGIEGIFLTAHADFSYAQEAIHMGGVDYILQPFAGEDVLRALRKAAGRVERQRAIHGMDRSPEGIRRRKGNMLDGLARKLALGSDAALEQAFNGFAAEERAERGAVDIYPMLLEIVNWSKVRHGQGERMLPQFIINVLEEIFEPAGGGVTVSSLMENRYWILLSARGSELGAEGLEGGLREFERFVRTNMEFRLALYPAPAATGEDFARVCRGLLQRADANAEKKPGVFLRAAASGEESGDAGIAEQVKAYIARNLSRNISRGDVAAEVHLTEEYFSRLFSRQTGYTFKDYLLQEKMRVAKKLLESSSLSVSIIASKVGYDYFSHFSQIFKKVVGETPQEYRKNHGKT